MLYRILAQLFDTSQNGFSICLRREVISKVLVSKLSTILRVENQNPGTLVETISKRLSRPPKFSWFRSAKRMRLLKDGAYVPATHSGQIQRRSETTNSQRNRKDQCIASGASLEQVRPRRNLICIPFNYWDQFPTPWGVIYEDELIHAQESQRHGIAVPQRVSCEVPKDRNR